MSTRLTSTPSTLLHPNSFLSSSSTRAAAATTTSLRLIRSNEVATSTDAALAGANLGVQYILRSKEVQASNLGVELEEKEKFEEGQIGLDFEPEGGKSKCGEVEWSYPDGGWRAWKVVFVSSFCVVCVGFVDVRSLGAWSQDDAGQRMFDEGRRR